ncbi:hypothetical protein [Cellulophaga omnivescoria]|uniref:hypothetical protein n=1 Tax=Cellulophaga omnivescoria TaxID=1888890 RepID=UPI000984F09E|nr:hypothetical protein [Cellulophaga omnivescoria]
MKKTLEYKILKYLSENNNGTCIDVSAIENNSDFLKSVIKDLKERNFIETLEYPGKPMEKFVGIIPSDKPAKCKIKLSGIEYLESLKPQPIPKYQKIYLPLFIVFGISTMTFAYLNYSSNNKNEILKFEVDSLKNVSRIYKDSVGLLKLQVKLYKHQSLIDTLENKN